MYFVTQRARLCMFWGMTERLGVTPCFNFVFRYVFCLLMFPPDRDAFRLQLFRLEEKSASQKLSILFSKSLYPTAIALAKSEGLDAEEVAMIHKQYADSLYAKGYFEEATTNYVQTLGWVQPSYVIRKVCRICRSVVPGQY